METLAKLVSLWQLASLVLVTGKLYDVFEPCCLEGVKWSSDSYRCDNYPAPVVNISDADQAACLSIIEICCIKQTQMQTCEDGKQMALDGQICAIRDMEPGAEQFRECCHCCRLGVVARDTSQSCSSPNLGEPCDSKYRECCKGEASGNLSFTGGSSGRSPRNTGSQDVDRDDSSEAPQTQDNLWTDLTTPAGVDTSGFQGDSGSTDSVDSGSEEDPDDVDECLVFGVCSHICVNTRGGFFCSCPPGMVLDKADNRTCREDINLEDLNCELNNPCEQRCIDKEVSGGVECRCYNGFRLAVDLTSCEDIDECEEGTAVCDPGQRCINTRGRYACMSARCPSGYVLNSLTGQCELGPENECSPGFAFNSITGRCEDLNECGLGVDHCRTGERCENTVGSYVCRRVRHCGTGYTLDEASQKCLDNDECLLGTHNCNGRGYTCQNTYGSFRCVPMSCPKGYLFDTAIGDCQLVDCDTGMRANEAGICKDIDECEEYGPSTCTRHQKCVNTRGSYFCRNLVSCPPGYEPTDNSGCQDINECELGTHKCGAEQQCVNRQGSYFCQCPRGLRHDDSGRCLDVDECAYGAAICPSNSRCVNTMGSFKCDCVEGLVSDENDRCTDVDECADESVCEHNCVNVLGTFFCSCNRGYQLRDDKRTCEGQKTAWVEEKSLLILYRLRCKRISLDCPECRRGLISQSYNFLSFASNVLVPAPLFSMSAGHRSMRKAYTWNLDLVSARPLVEGIPAATQDDFKLDRKRHFARVTLLHRIEGPQDVVLKLSLNVSSTYKGFEGSAESKIYLFVTEKDTNF
ncbi:fibulin-1 [Elysia marginata]|uniref:Fibulin-1 n=1 Tax=Elysia marginata TaxID=1093978 RepID=A0AAV4I6J8_9GAST|nr:fibulin-1 [Elysia marginata]